VENRYYIEHIIVDTVVLYNIYVYIWYGVKNTLLRLKVSIRYLVLRVIFSISAGSNQVSAH